MADICVVVICGLPASGKSRFCHQLKQSSLTRMPYHFVIIEYDKLLTAETEKLLIEEEDEVQLSSGCGETSAWKKYRSDIFNCVDLFIGALRSFRHTKSVGSANNSKSNNIGSRTKDDNDDKGANDSDSCTIDSVLRRPYHNQESYLKVTEAKRFDSMQPETEGPYSTTDIHPIGYKTCDIINKDLLTRFNDKYCDVCQILDSAETPLCIVIDDNMYYRSMRYSYYQLARKYSTGFCQVHVQTSVDEALVRNRQRKTCRVTESTIRQMAEKFEEPHPSQNTWEQNTVVFCDMPDLDDCTNESIHQLITQALSHPIEDTTEKELQTANQAREICSANFLHQSDQVLRKLVSLEMVKAKDYARSKQELKALAERLQLIRRQLAEDLKLGEICVPKNIIDMTTDASKDDTSDLFVFLKDLFDSRQCQLKETSN